MQSIGGTFFIGTNYQLSSLIGLYEISSIGENLEIYGCNALSDLTGLDSLSSVLGELNIHYNDALLSLTGIENIEPNSINDLYINNNDILSNCNVQNVCEYLINLNGAASIHFDKATLNLGISDLKGIEKQISLDWNNSNICRL